MKITNYNIIKKTEKALLLEIEGKKYWFQLSKIDIKKDYIEIPQDIYDNAMTNEVKVDCVKIFASFEDYSEKVFKLIVQIKKETYEADKFIFVPKATVVENASDYVVFPKWIWDKSINEILEKEVSFFNDKYSENCTINDYEILTEFEEISI
ncbi:hypothetical protein [Flavobacterium psychrophilum]|uniref:hypothetical protein n=1 Tax=Flavobacterium psychrophilum TaxID=96345 RepID=UPI00106AE1B2|nr:hypothetical protein [Flavobacterium psychrophilum]